MLSDFNRYLLFENLSDNESDGYVDYFPKNKFTCVVINDDFSDIALEIMGRHGYQKTSCMVSKTHSPKTHVSVLMWREQQQLNKHHGAAVVEDLEDECKTDQIYFFLKLINSLTGIDFNINNVTTFFHENKRTGVRKVNLTLEIESPSIRQLRMDLGYKPYNKVFNMHLTLLEQEI